MNNSIQFWRYLFTCVICMLHFEVAYFSGQQPIFKCGYLGVEFFFILSGFFLMKHAENSTEPSLVYTLKKVKRFYPDLIICWLLLILNLAWLSKYDVIMLFKELSSHIWEYLLFNSTGITWNMLNMVTWYLSALLITGYFIYWIIQNGKKEFIEFIAPLTVFLIYSYYGYCGGGIDFHLQWAGITLHSILRAWGGVSVGCLTFALSQYFPKMKITTSKRRILSLLEVLVIIAVGRILLRRTDKTSMDLLAIPAFVVLILFEYNGWTYLSKILDSKISNFLGSLSLGMYLNQNLIIGYYIRTFRGTLYFVDSLCFIAFLSMFSFFIFNIKKILIQTLRYIRKVK